MANTEEIAVRKGRDLCFDKRRHDKHLPLVREYYGQVNQQLLRSVASCREILIPRIWHEFISGCGAQDP
jgi:hypothetical protein